MGWPWPHVCAAGGDTRIRAQRLELGRDLGGVDRRRRLDRVGEQAPQARTTRDEGVVACAVLQRALQPGSAAGELDDGGQDLVHGVAVGEHRGPGGSGTRGAAVTVGVGSQAARVVLRTSNCSVRRPDVVDAAFLAPHLASAQDALGTDGYARQRGAGVALGYDEAVREMTDWLAPAADFGAPRTRNAD